MSSTNCSFLLLLVFFLSSATALATASGLPDEMTTHLHCYFHAIYAPAPNATTYTVVSLHNNASSFGNIIVYDSFLTEGPETTSKLIGRAQGIDVSASLTDQSIMTMANYVFTDGKYNGSSLASIGRADPASSVAERTIVGGSGQFRMARGYSLAKIIEATSSTLLFEFDFYVTHY